MDNETIIIMCILVAIVVVPIAFLKLWHRPSRLTLIRDTSHKQETDTVLTKAEILEEVFRLEGIIHTALRSSQQVTIAECNLISRKVNPFHQGAFPIVEGTSDREINKWLKHPYMNTPMPDPMIIAMAEQTPVPPKTIENILKRLLQESYDSYLRIAEERLKSRLSTTGAR